MYLYKFIIPFATSIFCIGTAGANEGFQHKNDTTSISHCQSLKNDTVCASQCQSLKVDTINTNQCTPAFNDSTAAGVENQNRKIKVPKEINTKQIRIDLIGKKITDQPDNYFPEEWSFTIEKGDIKNLEITKAYKYNGKFVLKTKLVVQKEKTIKLLAVINLIYAQDNEQKWRLNFVHNKKLYVVKSGKYDKCISSKREIQNGNSSVELKNNSNLNLIIGGEILSEKDNKWNKFILNIKPNETIFLANYVTENIKDYRINFVERNFEK